MVLPEALLEQEFVARLIVAQNGRLQGYPSATSQVIHPLITDSTYYQVSARCKLQSLHAESTP
eukprot:8100328-Pyramimonas_sp.AAC.1